jgi:hypothetical protein
LDWPFAFIAAVPDLALVALESVVLAMSFPIFYSKMGTTRLHRFPAPGLARAEPRPHKTNFRFSALDFSYVSNLAAGFYQAVHLCARAITLCYPGKRFSVQRAC